MIMMIEQGWWVWMYIMLDIRQWHGWHVSGYKQKALNISRMHVPHRSMVAEESMHQEYHAH